MFVVAPAVVAKILLDELEALFHARRHGGFDALAVSLELFYDDGRHEEFNFALMNEHADGHDPPLAVAPLRQVEPGGSVHEQMQHRSTLSVLRRDAWAFSSSGMSSELRLIVGMFDHALRGLVSSVSDLLVWMSAGQQELQRGGDTPHRGRVQKQPRARRFGPWIGNSVLEMNKTQVVMSFSLEERHSTPSAGES